MSTISGDAYAQASYLEKLRESKTFFLTDLDGTFASRNGGEQEFKDRGEIRALAAERHFVEGAVTARTPALTMSSDVYYASCEIGFKEAPPLCGVDPKNKNKRTYVPLELLPQYAHCRDWDIVAGFGSGIFPRQGKGYAPDVEFDHLLNYDYTKNQPPRKGVEPLSWRLAAYVFLVDCWPFAREHLKDIEYRSNYQEGKVDVMPLPYRIQLHFEGVHGLKRLRQLRSVIHQKKDEGNPIALRMAVVDESKPGNTPEESSYTIYLVPWAARKEKMINHLFFKSAEAAGVASQDVRLFYAGDTPTDLRAGLWAGAHVPLTFLLATGSVLAPYLIGERQHFGEESLSFLWESLNRKKRRFRKTGKKGVYTFNIPSLPWQNTIVIGDERYPKLSPPGSVLAFLEEFAAWSAPR